MMDQLRTAAAFLLAVGGAGLVLWALPVYLGMITGGVDAWALAYAFARSIVGVVLIVAAVGLTGLGQ